MNRGTMRELLREQIQERTPAHFSDSILNKRLIQALQKVQTKVIAVDPNAFHQIDRGDVVANRPDYPWPVGMLYEFEVAILDPSSGLYVPIDLASYARVRRNPEQVSGNVFSHRGREVYLYPTPSTTVTLGLQVDFMPTLTIATDDEECALATPLHQAVVDWAEILCAGHVGGASAEAKDRLAVAINSIPQWYRVSEGPGEPLSVDLGGDRYSMGSTRIGEPQ